MDATVTTAYPSILLPGPVTAAHTVTILSRSNDYRGRSISKYETFPGDGSGLTQVLEEMQADYSGWHPYLGCVVEVDYGNGPTRRVLDERFGQFNLLLDTTP